jgi:hypothetical protein
MGLMIVKRWEKQEVGQWRSGVSYRFGGRMGFGFCFAAVFCIEGEGGKTNEQQ